MRFCNDHWAALRDAIRRSGLDPLVAGSGMETARRLAEHYATEAANFEPLMFAHNKIVARTLDAAGLDLIGMIECPICWALAHDKGACEAWIGQAADDARGEAIRLGLIPRESVPPKGQAS